MKLPEPSFEVAEQRQLVALSGQYSMATRHEIPALWQTFWQQQWHFDGEEEAACFGASFALQPDEQFSYAVGVHVKPLPASLPEGTCVVTLSAGRYAVFRMRGPVEDIPAAFDAIFCQWLPAAGVELREGAVFERYPHEASDGTENMTYEIWVPVSG